MSHPGQRRAQATSFGSAAAAYERGRPPYPEQAIDWLVPPGAARVVDLGAGTGKLSRQLARRGLEVIAIEPSAGMREQLHRAAPGAAVTAGSGERIPLAGQSVDAVLAAQAWHWVDPALAVPEAARVLVPGGRLGVLWNLRDERTDWVAELSALMHLREPRTSECTSPISGHRSGRWNGWTWSGCLSWTAARSPTTWRHGAM